MPVEDESFPVQGADGSLFWVHYNDLPPKVRRIIEAARALVDDDPICPMSEGEDSLCHNRKCTVCRLICAVVEARGVITPVPMQIFCPRCLLQHIDEGDWSSRPHSIHLCQECGHEWRPHPHNTVGASAIEAADQENDEWRK